MGKVTIVFLPLIPYPLSPISYLLSYAHPYLGLQVLA